MTYPDRFATIHRVIQGEITWEDAQKLMGVAEVMPLELGGEDGTT